MVDNYKLQLRIQEATGKAGFEPGQTFVLCIVFNWGECASINLCPAYQIENELQPKAHILELDKPQITLWRYGHLHVKIYIKQFTKAIFQQAVKDGFAACQTVAIDQLKAEMKHLSEAIDSLQSIKL
jgi:hypothetical protein